MKALHYILAAKSENLHSFVPVDWQDTVDGQDPPSARNGADANVRGGEYGFPL